MRDLRTEGCEGGTVRRREGINGKGVAAGTHSIKTTHTHRKNENKEILNTRWCLELRCMTHVRLSLKQTQFLHLFLSVGFQ